MISPLLFLAAVTGITALAWALDAVQRRRIAAQTLALASHWNMRYLGEDRFNLAVAVAQRLPIPGAADVLVRDVIFVQQGEQFVYYFTVEYTLGVIRAKRRRTRVGSVREFNDRPGGHYSPVVLAPAELDRREQYQWLHARAQSADAANEPALSERPGTGPAVGS